ncbi:MAG: TetR/AcrR family transcriptional regulator [Acidobacteria bacterium]|nr:MAG: TetR/AcrR family transcriptional regulator [Acidobacteriota bacterium]REJ98008.1 MAG: TetR/AcrR family transcriptional regulator [Acidobacteriota bacterium]REK16751.1 MAG: TetR/AcrR family transcriptional regulator [Acidobacteriota bacterium]REK42662.1 MAG: TetR/AcrR family transcriptional regulator [Acidobacteriota bacterium]
MQKTKSRLARQRKRRPPRQDRSKKTYEALLDAAEKLLKDRPWEQISTVAIMAEAGCSNGAIYGRFKSKDDLLVGLYERHDAHLKRRHSEWLKSASKANLNLEEFLDRELDNLIRTLEENKGLLREMGLLSRIRPEVVSESVRSDRKVILDQIVKGVLRYRNEFKVPDPDRAAELMVFAVSTVIRESILYQGPHYGTLKMDRAELKNLARRIALGYLGISPKG